MNTIVWLGLAFAVVALLVLAARNANRGRGGADGYSGGDDGHACHDPDAGGSDGGGCDGGGDGGD